MKERLQRLGTRIDNLVLRERVLLFVAIVGVLVTLWNGLLMQPLDTTKRTKLQQLERVRADTTQVNRRIQAVLDERNTDPNETLRRHLDETDAALARLDARIAGTMGTLVAPQDMARVLEDVLTRQAGLQPLKVESLPPSPVMPREGEDAAAGLYRHRMRLTLEGSYLEAVAYLRELQSLPWSFYWDRIEVDATDYPRTVVVLTVSTLGLKEGWIGV